jgi:hypothetical protein
LDGERPPKLVCTLCELNDQHTAASGDPEPLYPHEHLDGQIPLLPCRLCFLGVHSECQPGSPYWCNCSHDDCRIRML